MNDLSVQGQFESPDHFMAALKSFLSLRRFDFIRERLFCSRDEFRKRTVLRDQTVQQVLSNCSSRDLRNAAFQWIDRGPFMESDRIHEPDDLFQFEGNVVTHQGLGEAARRVRATCAAATFSFKGGNIDFSRSPLDVVHGLEENPFSIVQVVNVDHARTLLDLAIEGLPRPSNWDDLLTQCRDRFDRLMIGRDVEGRLSREPFHDNIASNIVELLGALQLIMENRNDGGTFNAEGLRLHAKYFEGYRPWFVPESSSNEHAFESKMTFRDPEDVSRRITCFWHGRIQMRQLRVHFEWPVPALQRRLKVPYIGPKISKK